MRRNVQAGKAEHQQVVLVLRVVWGGRGWRCSEGRRLELGLGEGSMEVEGRGNPSSSVPFRPFGIIKKNLGIKKSQK